MLETFRISCDPYHTMLDIRRKNDSGEWVQLSENVNWQKYKRQPIDICATHIIELLNDKYKKNSYHYDFFCTEQDFLVIRKCAMAVPFKVELSFHKALPEQNEAMEFCNRLSTELIWLYIGANNLSEAVQGDIDKALDGMAELRRDTGSGIRRAGAEGYSILTEYCKKTDNYLDVLVACEAEHAPESIRHEQLKLAKNLLVIGYYKAIVYCVHWLNQTSHYMG